MPVERMFKGFVVPPCLEKEDVREMAEGGHTCVAYADESGVAIWESHSGDTLTSVECAKGPHCNRCVMAGTVEITDDIRLAMLRGRFRSGMTVDEISKVLGYEVKVVGSEKADD